MRGKASIVPAVGWCKFLLATRSEVSILLLACVHSPSHHHQKKKWGGRQSQFSKVPLGKQNIQAYRESAVSRINPLNPYISKHILHIVFRTFAMAVV